MTNVIAYLLVIGLSGLIKLRAQLDRTWSWFIFLALSCVFGEYYIQNSNGYMQSVSVLWGYSQLGNITIDFHPTQVTNQLIIPLFFVMLAIVCNNNIFRFEEKRCALNSFIILNFITLLLLICAENYVQLITMVFISDIMGYLILKDTDSSHRYVVYNFFADMCLFMILALACGKIQSLDINRLLGYEQIGRHKDFVSLVTALALFIKLGSFPFQSYLLDIKAARFQRTTVVNLISVPLAGILLVLKLHNLLLVSDIFLPLFKIVMWLTILEGLIGFIARRNLQKKIVCLNLSFIGLLMLILAKENFNWNNLFSVYYITVCLFNQLIVQIYYYKNREADMIKIMHTQGEDIKALKWVLIQMTVLSALFIGTVWRIFKENNSWPLFLMGCAIVLVLSIVLNQIYKPFNQNRLNYQIASPLQKISVLVNTSILIPLLLYIKADIIEVLALSVCFLTLISSGLGKYLYSLYENQNLQDKDLSKSFFFYTLVAPFTYISRALWLLIDFYFSEKIIASNLALLNNLATTIFLKVNKRKYSNFILFFMVGIIILVLIYRRSISQ